MSGWRIRGLVGRRRRKLRCSCSGASVQEREVPGGVVDEEEEEEEEWDEGGILIVSHSWGGS